MINTCGQNVGIILNSHVARHRGSASSSLKKEVLEVVPQFYYRQIPTTGREQDVRGAARDHVEWSLQSTG